jgi:hypothetical protein
MKKREVCVFSLPSQTGVGGLMVGDARLSALDALDTPYRVSPLAAVQQVALSRVLGLPPLLNGRPCGQARLLQLVTRAAAAVEGA